MNKSAKTAVPNFKKKHVRSSIIVKENADLNDLEI
jgi:hypothetical protein